MPDQRHTSYQSVTWLDGNLPVAQKPFAFKQHTDVGEETL